MGLSEQQEKQEVQYSFPYHYIDLQVDSYRLIYDIEYLELLEVVKHLLKPYRNQEVLDIGCGDGRLLYELKKEKLRVSGTDYSEQAIIFARAFSPDVNFFVQDVKKPFKKNFDAIVLMEVLEHFPPQDIAPILDNLKKSLKKDGELIITVPSKNMKLIDKHYQHFTPETLRATLLPNFSMKYLRGYGGLGFHRFMYNNFVRLGVLLFPFRKALRFLDGYYVFLRNYFRKNLALGNPKTFKRLVAVCEPV